MATLVAECGLVASFASPLLGCVKFVFRPIYITTINFLNLASNLDALQRKIQDLSHLSNQVTQQVDETARNGGLATHQATQWQRQAHELIATVEQIIHVDTTNSGCFFRYGLSKKVSKSLKEVHRLTEAYPTQLVLTKRQEPVVEHIPVVSVEDQPTASQNLATLMKLLSKDGVTSIGVWGMGGVGKTTLLKNLNNKLCTNSFGKVIWTTVSRDMNYKLVRMNIAKRLGLDFEESDQVSMAAQLHRRLLKEDKFLLILDDVWEPIDLDRLGIPQPEMHKGYKIVLTTRSQAVCMQMAMDEQFKILTLNESEAWQLFTTTVGEVGKLASHAKAVARECRGLPLAIKVVGAAMRRKERVELWDDALNELRRSRPFVPGIEKEVFNPLKWSYDSLPDEKIKSCFLFCCLYPEDYQIDTNALVRCWVGEGLIRVESSYKDSINRGIAIIENLKQAGLLEDGKYSWAVTMHDVVRDVGIWISSALRDSPKSLVLSGVGLAHVMDKVEGTESLKRVSFINTKIENLPDDYDYKVMQCHEGLTLFLLGNELSEEVVEFLLRGFRVCRVVNMASTNIKSLSHSIMQLGNLRTLLLKGCNGLKELPALGWEGLAKLEVLHLSRTDIRELPRGVKMLIKLCEMHLVDTKSLVSVPDGVFCMLSSLEVLNMEGSEYEWGSKEQVGDGKAHLEELEKLTKLRELHMTLRRKTSLNPQLNLTWIGRLTSFRVTIGVKALPFGFRGGRKELYIANINFAEKEERIEYLLSRTNATSLWLHGCGGLDEMVQNWALSTIAPCSNLKSLNINDCSFSSRQGCVGAQCDLLPDLEHVHLNGLEGVENLSQLFGPLGVQFAKLRQLTLWHCKELKYLLPVGGLIQNLGNLEVSNCYELEELFQYDNDVMLSVVPVPNLRRICLHYLPKLRTVCKKRGEWPSVEEIQVSECPKLRKLPLTIKSKDSIRVIRGGASWWNEVEWDDIATKEFLDPLFHGW